MTNTLYYGDNLWVLREHIADASADLIYLDPPFNTNASYDVLFRAPFGGGTDASIEAFDDSWQWGLADVDAFLPPLAPINCRRARVGTCASDKAGGQGSLL